MLPALADIALVPFLVIVIIGRWLAGNVFRNQEPVDDVYIPICAFDVLAGNEGCVHLDAHSFDANLFAMEGFSQFVRHQVNMFYFA